jgi:hypothetical protein
MTVILRMDKNKTEIKKRFLNMRYMVVMEYMDCTLTNSGTYRCIENNLLFMLINVMCLMTLLNFSMCLTMVMFYMVVMDCTLINFRPLKVHPKAPPVHADHFDVLHVSCVSNDCNA